jgi:hypothetical protein
MIMASTIATPTIKKAHVGWPTIIKTRATNKAIEGGLNCLNEMF